MMANKMQMIARFHEKYEIDYYGGPRPLTQKDSAFRVICLEEELKEYIEAIIENDLHQQLDALVDLVYFAMGTAYLQGFDFDEAFRRVHEANMKKRLATTADESKRGFKNDVIKPEGWKPADLSDLL